MKTWIKGLLVIAVLGLFALSCATGTERPVFDLGAARSDVEVVWGKAEKCALMKNGHELCLYFKDSGDLFVDPGHRARGVPGESRDYRFKEGIFVEYFGDQIVRLYDSHEEFNQALRKMYYLTGEVPWEPLE